MSKTPLFDAARHIVKEDRINFHTPGHKGNLAGRMALANLISRYDLTEIPGMDSLYNPTGPIKETEENLSRLYGSKASFICCGGATLALQTMLALALKPGDKVLMGRNIHVSAINAVTLLDLNPIWIIPRKNAGKGLAGRVTESQIEAELLKDESIKGVFITSPDYFGVISNISEIKKVCQKYDVALLVDNAHGAHLGLISEEIHPIHLGADICVDSAHKTLPVLTGSAFLHIANEKYIKNAKSTMALFGSTSPNYLMMLTMDTFIGSALEDGGRLPYIRQTQEMIEYQEKIKTFGYRVPMGPFDVSRFSISADVFGYTGRELYWWLRSANIQPEMYMGDFVVLIPSIRNQKEDYNKLLEVLFDIPKMKPLKNEEKRFTLPERKLTAREAFFSDTMTLEVELAVGKVASKSISTCPPGMPIIMGGEVVTKEIADLLKLSGNFTLKVVK